MRPSTQQIAKLCIECAETIHDGKPPSERYAKDTARLLLLTAATESHFVYRRQTVFDWSVIRGAWGLWQTELGSVQDGMKMLATRKTLKRQAALFLNQGNDTNIDWLLSMTAEHVLHLIHGHDRLAVLFARLHYLRRPGAIPGTLRGQADYWKRHYNTPGGKGTASKAINDWHQFNCDGLIT